MTQILKSYIPICDAVTRLLWPHAEAVVHDLAKGEIFYIANSYSKRRTGSASLNDVKGVDFKGEVIGPYGKTNWNGRRLKSVTTVIRDGKGKPVGLLCINHDVEAFSALKDQLLGLVEIPAALPRKNGLVTEDWREHINAAVADYLKWRNATLAGLTSSDVDDLIRTLSERGLFSIRKAIPYTAEILNVSRATIYNKLKAGRAAPSTEVNT